MPENPAEENQAKRWAFRARMHYREYLPATYRGIEDKDSFFAELGELAWAEIGTVYHRTRRGDLEFDMAAMKMATETVTEMVFPDPEAGHEEGWGDEARVADSDEEYEAAEDFRGRI